MIYFIMENIFSQTSNELIQQSINEVSEQIQKDLQPSAEKVKNAARELIKYTQEIENEYRNIVNQKNAFNSSTDIETVFHFTKKMIKNNTFDFFYGADDMIDSQKLLDVLVKAFDYDLSGEIAHMERKNGDIIKMIID